MSPNRFQNLLPFAAIRVPFAKIRVSHLFQTRMAADGRECSRIRADERSFAITSTIPDSGVVLPSAKIRGWRRGHETLHRASGKVPVESETITAAKGIRAVIRLNAGNADAR